MSKISLFVLCNSRTWQTPRRTPCDGIYRAYAYASRGKKWPTWLTTVKLLRRSAWDQQTVAYWGEAIARPTFGMTVNFWIIFVLFFVSFVSPLNRKIRVPRLLITVRVFCLLKTSKMHPNLSLRGQKYSYFFLARGPAPSNTPYSLRRPRRLAPSLLKS